MKKIIELLKLDADATENQVASAVDALVKENAALKSAKAQVEADEKIIREKMSHGLTRDQAISVINRQREHDKAKAAAAATAQKKAKETSGQ